MISKRENKMCIDPENIEGRDQALNDGDETWCVVCRNQFTQCGILSLGSLRSMGLFWNRPSSELVYMPRSMYRDIVSLHNRQVPKDCNIVVWKFWVALNPNKLLCECSPEEYHHLATLIITLRNRIKALRWNVENDSRYKFNIYKPWVKDNDSFILWVLKNGFNDPSQQISRIDKTHDWTPDNLEITQ